MTDETLKLHPQILKILIKEVIERILKEEKNINKVKTLTKFLKFLEYG